MHYHNITYPDMNNGDGLRVVLWLSGCSHHCYNCQNPQTWNPKSGILFDEFGKLEIFEQLSKDYISGLTLTGGDPLHENNLDEVLKLTEEIRLSFPEKTIWIYSGYTWEDIFSDTKIQIDDYTAKINENYENRQHIISLCDVFVDGEYIEDQRDVTLHWCGSSNQKVIDVQKTLRNGEIILWED